MTLSDWLRIYICNTGRTACIDHVIKSLHAEMLEDYIREMEEFDGKSQRRNG